MACGSQGEQNAMGELAEGVWRSGLEQSGVRLAPKAPFEGGPDALRVGLIRDAGEVDPGWDWAELKPNTPSGISKGMQQMAKRRADGWLGRGALFLYDTEGGGAFSFKPHY